MPRSRIRLYAAALSAVVVLSAACGGGGDDSGSASQADAGPVEVPGVAASEAGHSGEGDPEGDAVAELEPVQVRLGDRFVWCAQVQAVWDDHTAAFAAEAEAAEAVSAAVAARTAATDELDQAEAAQALEAAQERYRDARANADAHAGAAIEPLLQSANADNGGDATRDIAYRRAWEAFVSEASSAEVALMQLPDDVWVEAASATTTAPPATTAAPVEAGELQSDSEQAESLAEAAAAASNAAAEFSAQAVSFSDEAIAARAALRDALVAARDARDAAAVPDEATAAVASLQLVRDIAVAVEATHLAAANAAHATRVTRRAIADADAAGLAGADQGLLNDAIASQSAAEAAQARIRDEISDSFWGYWDLDEQSPRQALWLARSAAHSAVLLHSTAHLAFARSLGESCR